MWHLVACYFVRAQRYADRLEPDRGEAYSRWDDLPDMERGEDIGYTRTRGMRPIDGYMIALFIGLLVVAAVP
jgi:hypothetical protein